MDAATIQRLFAARGGMGRGAQPHNLEFKAGRMTCEGKTVTPDPRKGTLKIDREADGKIHFRWKSRESAAAGSASASAAGREEANISFGVNEGTFEGPIDECSTGRVLLLRLKPDDTKYFWWMQEPSDKKDKEIVDGACALIRGEGRSSSMRDAEAESLRQLFGMPASGGAGGRQAGPSAAELDQQQMEAAIRASMMDSGPSAAASSSGNAAAAASGAAAAAAAGGAGSDGLLASIQAMMQQREQVQPEDMTRAQFVNVYPHSLTQVLDAESVLQEVGDDDIQQLAQHLPEGVETRAQLEEHLRSPQLRQALRRFQGALTSSQMGSLMAQLGLPFTEMGLQGFFTSVQSQEAPDAAPAAAADGADEASPAAEGAADDQQDQQQPPAAGDAAGKPPGGA